MKLQPRRAHYLLLLLASGLMLMLPLLLLVFLVRHGVQLLEPMADWLGRFLPLFDRLGPLGDALLSMLFLLLLTLVLGLVAMTGIGRRVSGGFWQSSLVGLPPFSWVRGYLGMTGLAVGEVKVVLVPCDQGRTLAFLFGPATGDPLCVFVPSAPDWRNGQIALAARADVEETDLSYMEATQLLMQLGRSFEPALLGRRVSGA